MITHSASESQTGPQRPFGITRCMLRRREYAISTCVSYSAVIEKIPVPSVKPGKSCEEARRVGATNLVARCRCDSWFRATWYVAPTDRCFSKIRKTNLELLLCLCGELSCEHSASRFMFLDIHSAPAARAIGRRRFARYTCSRFAYWTRQVRKESSNAQTCYPIYRTVGGSAL